MTCTTADCNNEASTYLCGQCVSDLQQWLDMVPTLISALNVTIAKQDNVRPAGSSSGGGGASKPGSAAPINLDALQLQNNLRSVTPNANAYTHNENAAGLAWLIQDWITKAEHLVSGPEEPFIDHEGNRKKVQDIAPPMPTKELRKWLREQARINVTSMDIRNWVRRGKLHAVERGTRPTYRPHEVLNAWKETQKESC